MSARSCVVAPRLAACRPSTTSSRIAPSSRWPTAERGLTSGHHAVADQHGAEANAVLDVRVEDLLHAPDADVEAVLPVEADEAPARPARAEIDLALKDDQAVGIGAGAHPALVQEAAGVDAGHGLETLGEVAHGEAAASEAGGDAAHDDARGIEHGHHIARKAAAEDRADDDAVAVGVLVLRGGGLGRPGRGGGRRLRGGSGGEIFAGALRFGEEERGERRERAMRLRLGLKPLGGAGRRPAADQIRRAQQPQDEQQRGLRGEGQKTPRGGGRLDGRILFFRSFRFVRKRKQDRYHTFPEKPSAGLFLPAPATSILSKAGAFVKRQRRLRRSSPRAVLLPGRGAEKARAAILLNLNSKEAFFFAKRKVQ